MALLMMVRPTGSSRIAGVSNNLFICVLCVQHGTSPTINVPYSGKLWWVQTLVGANFGELITKHIFILVNLNIYNVI